MNFFNDSWTANQHYALAVAQDYFVITHYFRALGVNKDARLQDSRKVLAELQALYPSVKDLFLHLRQTIKPLSIVECVHLSQTVPRAQWKLLLLYMSFHQQTLLHANENPVFNTKHANVLKTENPEASVLELVNLAVEKYNCEPFLTPGYELRDQFLSVMGPYVTIVKSAPSPSHTVAYRLFQGQPKYAYFDAYQTLPGIQRQFIRHATMSNAYEILFPATIPETVKLKTASMEF